MTSVQIAVERIQYLAREAHKSVHQVLQESGLGKSLLDNMKRGSMPSADKLATLADYFGCSVDYLLGRVPQPHLKAQEVEAAPWRVLIDKDAADLTPQEMAELQAWARRQTVK